MTVTDGCNSIGTTNQEQHHSLSPPSHVLKKLLNISLIQTKRLRCIANHTTRVNPISSVALISLSSLVDFSVQMLGFDTWNHGQLFFYETNNNL
jgi:hypothetical protein